MSRKMGICSFISHNSTGMPTHLSPLSPNTHLSWWLVPPIVALHSGHLDSTVAPPQSPIA